MRAHLMVQNKRGEILVDGAVEDFAVTRGQVSWITRRTQGDTREDHEHELSIHDVAAISWAVYLPGREG